MIYIIHKMAKKTQNYSTQPLKKTETPTENNFYFGKENYKWMLIGLALIVLGFLLMMGSNANTRPDGSFDPNYWNESIFSVVRIRIAPLLVILGFVVEVIAILKRKK